MFPARAALGLLFSLLLSACGSGSYSGAPVGVGGSGASGSGGSGGASGAGGSGGSGGGGFASVQAYFQAEVEPNLSFCRTCHVPGGVADTAGTSAATQGNLFLLSSDTSQDYNNVYTAWNALGGGIGSNKLLLNPSTASENHSGGQPWPAGSQPYIAMDTLLTCWATPNACAALLSATGSGSGSSGGGSGGGTPPTQLPLLGSAHGGHLWDDYCANSGKPLPDSSPLPADPRTLIVPGVNAGKAVNFNSYWKSCPNPAPPPATCGVLRQKVANGFIIGEGQGQAGTATMFGGSTTDTLFAVPSSIYNNLWKTWGLSARPAEFDELVAQRYGSPDSPVPNPYPLPGQDPNASKGGSGQLPLAFTQLRNSDGSWTGKIGLKLCTSCHNGQLGGAADGPGLGPQYGGAGSIGDFEVMFRDFTVSGVLPFASLAGLNIANNRGTGSIDQFQIGFIVFGLDKPQLLLNGKILFSAAIGTIKSPAWWNMGHRPQKFHGAVLPMDASRIDMAAYYPLQDFIEGKPPLTWVDAHDTDFQSWAESQPSPSWPYGYCSSADGTPGPNDNAACINTPLAQAGAILFHSKNLWNPALNNPVPAPPSGNGSCAGCHGAYSPFYVNNTSYLDTPALEGIAAYFVPSATIATDPVYPTAMQSLKNANGTVSPQILGNDFLYCGLGEEGDTRDPGMLAPPLYGIWAAAPYLHNGSVPNVWGVLKPSDRPTIWERVSAPPPSELAGRVVMGYDTNLQRAYDTSHLGWDYNSLSCGQVGTQPFIACTPGNPPAPALLQDALTELYQNLALLWNITLPENLLLSNQQIENRKIYNTYLYSQGNEGHQFTQVLTDQERAALIEYLKTL